ncbi:hypothetical protein IP87_10995 [beta proteobacterium AAP121]|nr:hypothetical protein IP80_06395 [beta proteobacterium AAP65]KPF97525.1 hypothetical protein IP87_10995 [beta proteobacterium AAP121]
MSDSSSSEFSLLLWTLGVLVVALALHLSNGWVRMAQRGPTLRAQWPAVAMAGAALGLGVNAALVLGMQAQPLSFVVGYAWGPALLLWGLALVVCLPVVVLPLAVRAAWALPASGALLALLVLALDAGWVWAAGFRPGVIWRRDLLGAAAVVLLLLLPLARWLSFCAAGEASPRRTVWRFVGVALAAVGLMAGEELLALAAGLGTQIGTIHQRQIPGTVLSLLAGVLLPLLMGAASLDLWLRRHQRRSRSPGDFQPGKRRKRRQRIRTL